MAISDEQKNLIQSLVTNLIQSVFNKKIILLKDRARESIGKMRNSNDMLTKQVASLKSDMTSLDLDIKQLRAEKQQLLEKELLLKKKNSSIQSELDKKTQTVNSNLKANCGKLATTNIILSANNKSISKKYDETKSRLATINTDLVKIQKSKKELETSKKELEKIIEEIKSENASQQQTNEILDNDIQTKTKTIENLKSELNNLETKHVNLESVKKELDKKNNELNQQVKQLNVNLTEKTEMIKQMETNTSSDKSEITKLIAKNVDLEYLIKTNQTLINSIKTMQQSFLEEQNTNEIQSSKYVSNIKNLNNIIQKYKEKNEYLKSKYETHLKTLGDKYEQSIKDNTNTIDEIQNITNAFSEKQLAISTKYKTILITINQKLEHLLRSYKTIRNSKNICQEQLIKYKNMIKDFTGEKEDLEAEAERAKQAAQLELEQQEANAAAASAKSAAEKQKILEDAKAAAAAAEERRTQELKEMEQRLADAKKRGEHAGKVAKYAAEILALKQELDEINSQILQYEESSAESINKIAIILNDIKKEQTRYSKYKSVYDTPIQETEQILNKSRDEIQKDIKTKIATMKENVEEMKIKSNKMNEISEQMSQTEPSNKAAASQHAEKGKNLSSESNILLASSRNLLTEIKNLSDIIYENIQNAQGFKTRADTKRIEAALSYQKSQGEDAKEATKYASKTSELYLQIEQTYKTFISIQTSVKKILDKSNLVKTKILQIKEKYKKATTDQNIKSKVEELTNKNIYINKVVADYELKKKKAQKNRDEALTAVDSKDTKLAQSKKDANQQILINFQKEEAKIKPIFDRIEIISYEISELKSTVDTFKTEKKLNEAKELQSNKGKIEIFMNKIFSIKQDTNTTITKQNEQLTIVSKEIEKIKDLKTQLEGLKTDVTKSVINPAVTTLTSSQKTIESNKINIQEKKDLSDGELDNINKAYNIILNINKTTTNVDNMKSKFSNAKKQHEISDSSKSKVNTYKQEIEDLTNSAVDLGIEAEQLVRTTLVSVSEAKIQKKIQDSASQKAQYVAKIKELEVLVEKAKNASSKEKTQFFTKQRIIYSNLQNNINKLHESNIEPNNYLELLYYNNIELDKVKRLYPYNQDISKLNYLSWNSRKFKSLMISTTYDMNKNLEETIKYLMEKGKGEVDSGKKISFRNKLYYYLSIYLYLLDFLKKTDLLNNLLYELNKQDDSIKRISTTSTGKTDFGKYILDFSTYQTDDEKVINNIIANIKQHLSFLKFNIDIDFLVFLKKKYLNKKVNNTGKIINTFFEVNNTASEAEIQAFAIEKTNGNNYYKNDTFNTYFGNDYYHRITEYIRISKLQLLSFLNNYNTFIKDSEEINFKKYIQILTIFSIYHKLQLSDKRIFKILLNWLNTVGTTQRQNIINWYIHPNIDDTLYEEIYYILSKFGNRANRAEYDKLYKTLPTNTQAEKQRFNELSSMYNEKDLIIKLNNIVFTTLFEADSIILETEVNKFYNLYKNEDDSKIISYIVDRDKILLLDKLMIKLLDKFDKTKVKKFISKLEESKRYKYTKQSERIFKKIKEELKKKNKLD